MNGRELVLSIIGLPVGIPMGLLAIPNKRNWKTNVISIGLVIAESFINMENPFMEDFQEVVKGLPIPLIPKSASAYAVATFPKASRKREASETWREIEL